MRTVAILVIYLLSSLGATDIASSQIAPPPTPKAVPANYRAQIVRQMSQAFDVGKIRDAGITPMVVTFVSLVHGTREVVCVATMQDAIFSGQSYLVTIITFKNGQAEILSSSPVRGTGSASKTKLNVTGYCRGLITSPLPEIARAKPSS